MLYNYKCENCDKEFEIKASLEDKESSDPEIFNCPACGSVNVKQQLTEANFISKSGDGHGGCAGGCCGGVCG